MIRESIFRYLFVIDRFKLQFKGSRISVGGNGDEAFYKRSSRRMDEIS